MALEGLLETGPPRKARNGWKPIPLPQMEPCLLASSGRSTIRSPSFSAANRATARRRSLSPRHHEQVDNAV